MSDTISGAVSSSTSNSSVMTLPSNATLASRSRAGEYASTKAGTHQNRVCTALKMCDYDNEYMSAAPTSHTNRECTALTTCTNTQWESAPKTDSSDRVCNDLTVCSATEFVLVAAGAFNNREAAVATWRRERLRAEFPEALQALLGAGDWNAAVAWARGEGPESEEWQNKVLRFMALQIH